MGLVLLGEDVTNLSLINPVQERHPEIFTAAHTQLNAVPSAIPYAVLKIGLLLREELALCCRLPAYLTAVDIHTQSSYPESPCLLA